MAIRRIRERAIAAVRNTAARVLFLCCLRQRTQVLDNDRRFIITQAEEGSTTVSANSCPGDLLAVQAAAGSLYILCFALFSTSDSPIWRGRHARESSAWFDALDRIGQRPAFIANARAFSGCVRQVRRPGILGLAPSWN